MSNVANYKEIDLSSRKHQISVKGNPLSNCLDELPHHPYILSTCQGGVSLNQYLEYNTMVVLMLAYCFTQDTHETQTLPLN